MTWRVAWPESSCRIAAGPRGRPCSSRRITPSRWRHKGAWAACRLFFRRLQNSQVRVAVACNPVALMFPGPHNALRGRHRGPCTQAADPSRFDSWPWPPEIPRSPALRQPVEVTACGSVTSESCRSLRPYRHGTKSPQVTRGGQTHGGSLPSPRECRRESPHLRAGTSR